MMQRKYSATTLGMQLIPATAFAFVEFTSFEGTVSHPDLFAPPLRVRHCPECGVQFMRVAFCVGSGLWIETTEPTLPWLQMKLSIKELFDPTDCYCIHRCRGFFHPYEVGQ